MVSWMAQWPTRESSKAKAKLEEVIWYGIMAGHTNWRRSTKEVSKEAIKEDLKVKDIKEMEAKVRDIKEMQVKAKKELKGAKEVSEVKEVVNQEEQYN